ncbi:MAG: ribonuclease III [Verrucomicrobia bacterium]|nr:ribonuclease III [Verrucomicrobiota bacterium]
MDKPYSTDAGEHVPELGPLSEDGLGALEDLEARIGYRFERQAWLEKALTHRSYRYESPDVEVDNERLEFLGDALLGFLVAAHLFREFKEKREGELTRLRSHLTNGESLCERAMELQLGQYLRMGLGEERTGGRTRPSNLANAMEALLGAVYLDGGVAAGKVVFYQIFQPALDALDAVPAVLNPKGSLQEYAQATWKVSPTYRLLEKSGPSHAAHFRVEVALYDGTTAEGRGASKQAAERAAASALLDQLNWPPAKSDQS